MTVIGEHPSPPIVTVDGLHVPVSEDIGGVVEVVVEGFDTLTASGGAVVAVPFEYVCAVGGIVPLTPIPSPAKTNKLLPKSIAIYGLCGCAIAPERLLKVAGPLRSVSERATKRTSSSQERLGKV